MTHSDRLVSAQILLSSLLELQRRGSGRLLEELEQTEPELADFLMEQCSALHQQLGELGGRPKATQKVYHRIEDLVLVCLLAQRQAHRALWEAGADGTSPVERQPSVPEGVPPPAPEPPRPEPGP